jgi:hypothetical protein
VIIYTGSGVAVDASVNAAVLTLRADGAPETYIAEMLEAQARASRAMCAAKAPLGKPLQLEDRQPPPPAKRLKKSRAGPPADDDLDVEDP